MITPPLFSVIVPCYGHEKYLRQAIRSLWDQQFRDFEIIAVDDGSPDQSGAILDELAVASSIPMQVIHRANHGAAASLNIGAAAASGRYLGFLNDDDAYHPDRLEVFRRAIFLDRPARWGFSAVEAINDRGDVLDGDEIGDVIRRRAIGASRSPLEAVRSLPQANTVVSSGNLVVKRTLFAELKGFRSLSFTHDWDLALRLLSVEHPYVAERRLYRYRIHTGNAYNQTLAASGTRTVADESRVLTQAYRERVSRRSVFVPQVVPAREIMSDDLWAIKATLWGMARLRSIPIVYSIVRRTMRSLRARRRK